MKSAAMAVLVLTLTIMTAPASAQERMQGAPGNNRWQQGGERIQGDGPGGPSQEKREEIRKKIEAIRIWRMTEELRLDSGTSAKMASLLSPIEQRRRDTMREQAETMQALRRTLEAQQPDETKLRGLLERLESSNRIIQELRNDEIKGLKNILSIEQQARFLVFQREFEREIREMIEGARSGPPGRSGQRTGPRPPERRDFRGSTE